MSAAETSDASEGTGLAQKSTPVSAWVAAATTFLISIPVMWWIGQIAIFAFGFVLWIIPWFLGGTFGTVLLPQGSLSFVRTEFDGPIIVFAFVAGLQNALMFWVLFRAARWTNQYGHSAEGDR